MKKTEENIFIHMKSLKPDSHMMNIGTQLKWKWFQVVRCKAI